ncbi:MAG: nucleoside triphosphate pyrophosphohydrolase [Victivallaceae bacterium]|nr:nucleoside triphosphate pyrophosphohydrolase [Victivallaceae bacterium]
MAEHQPHPEPTFDNLVQVIRRLRSPQGCPWDRKQTFHSLKPCLAEEVAELLDAIDNEDYANLCEELGDILLNLISQTVIAEENGLFTMQDVLREIIAKIIRRHPHVFAGVEVESVDDVMKVWAQAKAAEGKAAPPSVLDGVPRHLSALLTAGKVQKKAAEYGFDWENQEQILDKIAEEVAELKAALTSGNDIHIDEEIGDLLFAVVNLSRFRKRSTAEDLLNASVRKFRKRFNYIEKELTAQNIQLEHASIELMEKLWNQAKNKPRQPEAV